MVVAVPIVLQKPGEVVASTTILINSSSSISPAASSYLEADLYSYIDLITGGDDYELLYTVDPKNIDLIDDDSFIIGKIVSDKKINLYSIDNNIIDINNSSLGYKHF